MMKNYKMYFVVIVVLFGALSLANADWNFGDFTSGTDSWGQGLFGGGSSNHQGYLVGSAQQMAYPGTNGVLYGVSVATASGFQSFLDDFLGASSFDISPETTITFKVAFTGNAGNAQFNIFCESNGYTLTNLTSNVVQACDGTFSTYTIPVSAIPSPTKLTELAVQLNYTPLGTVTTIIDFVKSQGGLVPLPNGYYTDFKNYTDLNSWVVSNNVGAILNHTGAQNTTGLNIDTTGIGTMWFISMTTTTSGVNDGGQVRMSIPSDTYNAGNFTEWRIAISTTSGPNAGDTYVNGGITSYAGSGSFLSNNVQFPIDGKFHTYSWSANTSNYALTQLFLELYAHGNTEVKATVDYVKRNSTGTPLIVYGSSTLGVYTNPANWFSLHPGTPVQFSVVQGLAPFTWTLTTVSGTFGSLSTTSGSTVSFTGSGGSGYIIVTDAEGRSIQTPLITVTATSAPLVNDPEYTDIP